ncbi:MAG: hypothetical protein NTY35_11720 [Planctomycetota bacterium]|nr:hypothetical protein [Planctomycetota bacterium]
MNLKLSALSIFGFIAIGGLGSSQQCPGCTGQSANDSDNSSGCGSIAISVLVTTGKCLYTIDPDTGAIGCGMTLKCLTTITRSWNGVSPNTLMNFCVTQNGTTRCQQPQPNSGTGTGANVNTWQLSCGDGYDWSFTMPCPSGGPLYVSAFGECTQCGF